MDAPSFEADVILIGSGLAPLFAAHLLMGQGLEVAILNPSRDFFLERSETPFDLENGMDPDALEKVFSILSPYYPGSLGRWTSWSPLRARGGRDQAFVRARELLRAATHPRSRIELETRFMESGDSAHAEWLEGLQVLKRFPGYSKRVWDNEGVVGLLERPFIDIDLGRFGTAVLEFMKERLADRLMLSVSDLRIERDRVRFRTERGAHSHSLRVRKRVLFFWTAGQTQLLRELSRQAPNSSQFTMEIPLVRQWEKWTVVSREKLDPSCVGQFGGLWFWADFQGLAGVPEGSSTAAVVRAVDPEGVASEASFRGFSDFFHDFLGWDRFSVRSIEVYQQTRFIQPRLQWLEFGDESNRCYVVRSVEGAPWRIAENVELSLAQIERLEER